MTRPSPLGFALAAAALLSLPLSAQLSPSAEWAAHAANNYQTAANLTYLTANGYESKLDIYSRRGATTPQPTVVYFHGGFWAADAAVVPEARHVACGKGDGTTCHVERFWCTVRQRCARFVRKTPSFSKCHWNHTGSLWDFIHHYTASLP